jgi:bifunctional polynucleotide phosphatase/kinase
MNLKWIEEKSFLFGYSTDNLFDDVKTIKKIYMFDLDYTLIKTKSGKKFPTNKNDWIILYPNIKTKLDNLKDCLIGIVSNQKGLKSVEQKKDWEWKLNQISNKLRIDFVFASLNDDQYRKPLPGSYEYIKEHYKSIDWKKLEMDKKIYYIGDAFGRENDFSDTDVKYALNNGFKFKTPEIFFKINHTKESGTITYPVINYFNSNEQKKLFDEFEQIIKTHKKILIMTIGFPASGKSFLRKELIKLYPQFHYSNNDDIHNKVQSRMLVHKISPEYNFIIDDNTNMDKSVRDIKLSQFDDYYKVGIWFDYELDVCFHLNWMRMFWFGGKLLPKVTYYTLRKKFDSNLVDEGFNKFIKIDKIFKEFNLDNKIKYYF